MSLNRMKSKLAELDEQPLMQPFISLEYNILKIASGDTWTFFYIAVTITIGVGLFV